MEIESKSSEWDRLPIIEYKDEIVKAIDKNDVVVISGETGCGKSTQVPKYILQRQPKSRIIITQPRRLAAVSVATRVAYELRCPLGNQVGYHIGMDCKCNQKTRITYVTNGIFLQKLTNDESFFDDYTHFIFDEIHQRGLECDFSLIAMKLFLCKKKNKGKIILMSATLNSELFCKFFAKDKFGQFIKSKIIKEPIERRNYGGRGERDRRGRDDDKNHRQFKFVPKLEITKEDNLAKCITLQIPRKYSIYTHYIQEFVDREPRGFNSQPQLDDFILQIGLKVVNTYIQKGDILVFMPGLREIKKFSQVIVNLKNRYNVIELHSHYSETAYQQLFSKDGKTKIIISTNIAESSITLPDCKTVLDFCMSKQNYYDERTRIQRLELRWASKASLVQRAGRVGRVSDGIVVRLIPKKHMEKLNEYDEPQLRRSPLEKTILQIKKIESNETNSKKTKNSSIFEDPYVVLSNAFEPPEIDAINAAIDRLLEQMALRQNEDKQRNTPEYVGMKYVGPELRITMLGKLLVQVPCDIELAKSLLLSMQLGCFDEMLDVASILYNKKPFFIVQDRRQFPQEFIHTIIDYNRDEYSDLKIRHRIFNQWKRKAFTPWYESNASKAKYETDKILQDIMDDQNFYETFNGKIIRYSRLLNDFQKTRVDKVEKDFCQLRCVYSNNMRQILLYRQSLKSKILKGITNYRSDITKNDQFKKIALDICIFSAFKNNLMAIELAEQPSTSIFQNQGLKPSFSIEVEVSLDKFQKEVDRYIEPEEKKYDTVKMSKSFLLQGTLPILSKFMLPYRHKATLYGKCSDLFRQLFHKQPYYSYKMRARDVYHRGEVRIEMDSINGFLPYRGDHQGFLICSGYFESRVQVSANCTHYVQPTHAILLLLLFCLDVELKHHESHEFFNQLNIKGSLIKIPFVLTQSKIKAIGDIKDLLLDIFSLQDQAQKDAMDDQLIKRLTALMTEKYDYMPVISKKWEDMYIQQKIKRVDMKTMQTYHGIRYQPTLSSNDYFKRYNEWRIEQMRKFDQFVDILRYQSSKFICAKCLPSKRSLLCELDSFETSTKMFKFNHYCDSWYIQGKEVMCSAKLHRIGRTINEDNDVKVDSQELIRIMHPDLSTELFKIASFKLESVLQNSKEAHEDVLEKRRRLDRFECHFCSEDDHPFSARDIKKFMTHTRSTEHRKQIEDFTKGL